jgi:antitoxin HicB
MDWVFAVAIRREEGDYVVSVRDLPEVVTAGDDEKQALVQAADAIEASIGFRMDKGEVLPNPSPVQDGEQPVSLSALSSVKASLYRAWREAGISKAELARRIGQGENEVRRILALDHRTKLDRLEETAKALGLNLTVEVTPAT